MSSVEQNPDITLIESVIPHRPPHRWLDAVTDHEPGVSAEGVWTPGPEHYLGHFNEELQLLPGVKQIESAAQLGAFMIMSVNPGETIGLFGSTRADFPAPVYPGDTLNLSARPLTDKEKEDLKINVQGANEFWGKGTVKVGDVVTCEMVMSALVAPSRTALRMIERKRRGPAKIWDNGSQSWVEVEPES